jgi:2-hydroxychromene-2-carboxylate isomerase
MSVIEYFYSAHSAFAYLGSARLASIALGAGAEIVHKPYDLHRAMKELGSGTFARRSKAHKAYYFGREIERWAEHRSVPWLGGRPTHHSNDYTLANRMLIAALISGRNIDRLAHAVLRAHWRDDADLADPATLSEIAAAAGVDPQPLLTAAASQEVAERYDGNTEEAIGRAVFGSPTYFVDGDMFYGQDKLEFVERALQRPYTGSWPP